MDFGVRSPGTSADEIHKRIYAQIYLNYQEARTEIIDGPKRHVRINLRNNGRVQDVFHWTGRRVEYQHSNGEMSTVQINTLGTEMSRVRMPTPPELSDGVLRTVLSS
jgi:hypothetical protein